MVSWLLIDPPLKSTVKHGDVKYITSITDYELEANQNNDIKVTLAI